MTTRSVIVALSAAFLTFLGGHAASAEQAGAMGEEPAERLFDLKIETPGGMAFDGTLLWITDRVEMKLRGLDPRTGEERKALPSPGPWPAGLAFDGQLLWVADRQRSRFFALKTGEGLVVKEFESPQSPQGLTFDGTHLWVADGRSLHQITREDGTTITTFPAPSSGGPGPSGEQLGLAFAGGALWVSDRIRDRIYKVDPANGEVIDMFPSPGPVPAGLAVVDGRLLVLDVEKRRLDAITLASLPAVVRREPRPERVVLRRSIANRGPGTLAEADIYMAVPQSLASQDLKGEPLFQPAPSGFVSDQWGQRFAHFNLRDMAPGSSLDVTMTVEAVLYSTRWHIDPSRVGSLADIPSAIREAYLADGSKYDIQHASIQKAVKEALGDERRPYWMVRKIAAYIRKKMEYELAGGWNIAPTVIERGTGSCSEYTFVFIAMCRAAGIPARYVGAIVVRGDDASTDEYFHRWPEVYLPGHGWVPFDAQAGDKPEPERQAAAYGGLENRFLITTTGGGGSDIIGWDYNTTARWTCRGRCLVEETSIGDWYPAGRKPEEPRNP